MSRFLTALLLLSILSSAQAEELGEPVSFENASATFYRPKGDGPFPAILILSGHKPQTTSPQSALSRALTDAGFATLSYDEQGADSIAVDASGHTDMIAGSAAALAYLMARADMDAKRIGLIGSSAGAVIASALAAKVQSVAFVVLIGMPAEKSADARLRLITEVARSQGCGQAETDVLAKDFRHLISAQEGEETRAAAQKLLASMVSDKVIALEDVHGLLDLFNQPGARELLLYDPAPTLRKISVPMLALYGSLDKQAPPEIEVPALKKAAPSASVLVLPGLNHNLQDAKSGEMSEWPSLKGEPFAGSGAREAIVNWLAGR